MTEQLPTKEQLLKDPITEKFVFLTSEKHPDQTCIGLTEETDYHGVVYKYGQVTLPDEKFLDGYLDQVRVSNTARYSGTGSFTPSTSAYASDANTKFLLQSDIGGHSGAYGTAQSDGLSYYFTEIKGSKPIGNK